MKHFASLVVLMAMVSLLLTACIVGIIMSTREAPQGANQHQILSGSSSGGGGGGGGYTRRPPSPGVNKATCNELQPVRDLTLHALAGFWVLQEKLEFPDGMVHHTSVPNRDQTIICFRTEVSDVSEVEATLHTSFYSSHRLSKNFTGFIKVKGSGHWDFHMLSKDHDGMVVLSEPTSYFVFIECVKSSTLDTTYSVPGSVFVYTRGNLPESQMEKIRITIESMLRHNDETFLDFGAYCY